MADPLRCPRGHPGPFWYVESIEVHREVRVAVGEAVVVEAHWETGEGFDEGVPGSGYLLCRWRGDDGTAFVCTEELPLPEGVEPEFV